MMTKRKVLYKVRFTESERGWGSKSWWDYFETYQKAREAIDECNKRNQQDWDNTHRVPDYYIQCEDQIIATDK